MTDLNSSSGRSNVQLNKENDQQSSSFTSKSSAKLNNMLRKKLKIFTAELLYTNSSGKRNAPQESDQWYIKIGYKYLSLSIVSICTILSQPFLMVNLPVVTCMLYQSQSSNEQTPIDDGSHQGVCFNGNNMTLFVVNITAHMIFLIFNIYYQVQMNLNFNMPVAEYKTPWSTLRQRIYLVNLLQTYSAALHHIVKWQDIFEICMQVSVILTSLFDLYSKFTLIPHLDWVVHVIDVFLSAFTLMFYSIGIIIEQVSITFTYNSLYLLILMCLSFSAISFYVISRKRQDSLENFYILITSTLNSPSSSAANFSQSKSINLDQTIYTLVDFMASKYKNDQVKIKGLLSQLVSHILKNQQIGKFDSLIRRQLSKKLKHLKIVNAEKKHRFMKQLSMTPNLFDNNDKMNHSGNPSTYNISTEIIPEINSPVRIIKKKQLSIGNRFQQIKSFNLIQKDIDDMMQLNGTNQARISQQRKYSVIGLFKEDQNKQQMSPDGVHLQFNENNHDDIDYKKNGPNIGEDISSPYKQTEDLDMMQSNANFSHYFEPDFDIQNETDDFQEHNKLQDATLIIELIDIIMDQIKASQVKDSENVFLRLSLLKLRLMFIFVDNDKYHNLIYQVSKLGNFAQRHIKISIIKHIMEKTFHSQFQKRILEKSENVATVVIPSVFVFYENQREVFEYHVLLTTEMMMKLLQDLKLQNANTKDIQKRFGLAKKIVTKCIDLQRQFKLITGVNSTNKQNDLLIMYFHFLDKVVNMQNEARNVYKFMQDSTRNEKLSNRFFTQVGVNSSYRVNNQNMQNTGFILVGGNYSDLGIIIKVNTAFSKELQVEKEQLIGQRLEVLMPHVIGMFHIKIISNYIKLQIELFQSKSNLKKTDKFQKIGLFQDGYDGNQGSNEYQSLMALQDDIKLLSQEPKKWHFNSPSKILYYKDKHENLVPLISTFDMYFDQDYGIQFLCQTNVPSQLGFDESFVSADDVYMIMTDGFDIIQNVSKNLCSKFNLRNKKLSEERINIDMLSNELSNLNDSRFDNGAPILIDIKFLMKFNQEEGTQEGQQQKTTKFVKPSQSNDNFNIESQIFDSKQSMIQGMNQQIDFKNVCFVKREIIPYSFIQQQDNTNTPQTILNQDNNSRSYNMKEPVAIVYHIVFLEGMTSQMRETSFNYFQQYARKTISEQMSKGQNQGQYLMNDQFSLTQALSGGISSMLTKRQALNFTTKEQLNEQDHSRQNNNAFTHNSTETNQNNPDIPNILQDDSQFTFASMSSTNSTNHNDKISELKNEIFLSQVPIFVSLFQKIFVFYFFLFVIVSSVILAVTYESNKKFFLDIQSIFLSKQLYAVTTVVCFSYRSILNIANYNEQEFSNVIDNRFTFLSNLLTKRIESMRYNNNILRDFIAEYKNEDLDYAYKGPATLIFEMDEDYNVKRRWMSIDAATQLLIGKLLSFTENIGRDFSKIECDCAFSKRDIQRMKKRGYPPTQRERDSFWISENTNNYIQDQQFVLSQVFLVNSTQKVEVYKSQILSLCVSCICLAFLCAIAFLPYYLRMKRNLNINIYLLEKMALDTVNQSLEKVQIYLISVDKQRISKDNANVFKNKKKNDEGSIKTKIASLIKNGAKIGQNAGVSKMDEVFDDQKQPTSKINSHFTSAQTYKTTEMLNHITFEGKEGNKKSEENKDDFNGDNKRKIIKDSKTNQNKFEHRKKVYEKEDNEQDDDEEDEDDEDDENDEKSKKQSKKKSKQEEDDYKEYQQEKEVMRLKLRSISQMHFRSKINSILASTILAVLLSVFFILFYVLSSNTYTIATESIDKFKVFYDFEPYFITSLQFNREQLTKNEFNFFNFSGSSETSQVFRWAFDQAEELRKIKNNQPATLKYAKDFLAEMDSQNYCKTIIPIIRDSITNDSIPDAIKKCEEVADGIFYKSGFQNSAQTILNYFYMIQLRFESMNDTQRDAAYIKSELTNQKSIDYDMLYYVYLEQSFPLIQSEVTKSFQIYFESCVTEFIIVYALFQVILVVLIILNLFVLLPNIRREIYLTRKTIQLIPNQELMKIHNYEIAIKIKY